MATFAGLDAAYAWLEGHVNYERNLGHVRYGEAEFDLDAFARALGSIGSPQRGLRTLHIAGTRGKGSAALALESLLESAGLKTAVYTSPHLSEYRERIRIGGRMISPELFCELLGRIAAAEAENKFKTVFEILTALHFLAACESNADWAIVETGLGGRLDCTNVIDPGPVLFTRVALEHTRLLGGTIDAIATEKAAILKPGGWAVFGAQEDSRAAEAVFRRRATEVAAPLAYAPTICPLRELRAHSAGLDLDFVFEGKPLAIRTSLLGPFQAENIQTALAMLACLRERGIATALTEPKIAEALDHLTIPGRMQRVGAAPEWIFDGAHCPTAAAALARAMQAHFGDEPALAFVGMMADKDHEGFFAGLAGWGGWRGVVCYRPPSPRGLPAEKLAEAARHYFATVEFCDDLNDALQKTVHLVDTTIRIVACGTLFGIGPIQAKVRTGDGRTETASTPQT